MRVLKFGGSSLADADRFLRVSDIVVNTQKQAQVALVLSAPAKVTNHLVALVEQTSRGLDASGTLTEIEGIFTRLIDGLKAKYATLDDAKLKARMEQEFADVRRKMQGIILGFVAAISGVTFTAKKCVEEYAKMDDEMTNVRKYTGQAAEEVERMNEDFKKMDTRTPRQKLNQLAEDAGRLGITSTAAVEEFVDGADKINVALGDDLGDKAVSQIGKLAQMFGEDKTKGLRGAMLATGSAVNELAQNSSASAGYLVDFTARVAGVGKQAGFTQAQIMGLASVLDQNMQQDETAATAVQNLLAKMFQDSSKFAKIAGLNVKDFAKTLKEDANGALLQFLAAMRAKGGFADLAPMFEEMKMDGSRATGVLTVLADKLDDIKTAQNLASEAYSEGTSVLNEFETQNESVQAQLDKASKKFLDLSIELGQKLYPAARYCISAASLGVRALSTLVDFVKDYWRILIVLTAAIVTYTAVSKAKLIAEKAQMAWLNIMILREKAHLVLVGLKKIGRAHV